MAFGFDPVKFALEQIKKNPQVVQAIAALQVGISVFSDKILPRLAVSNFKNFLTHLNDALKNDEGKSPFTVSEIALAAKKLDEGLRQGLKDLAASLQDLTAKMKSGKRK